MATLTKSFNARYVAGETARVTVEDETATAVKVVCGASEYSLENADGVWSAAIPTASLVGCVRFAIFVTDSEGDVTALASGSFLVSCAGRSPKRAIVEQIDAAIQSWGTNPNHSIQVGELSITYKSLSELLAIRAQYVQQAEEEETGSSATGGVRMVEVCF